MSNPVAPLNPEAPIPKTVPVWRFSIYKRQGATLKTLQITEAQWPIYQKDGWSVMKLPRNPPTRRQRPTIKLFPSGATW